MKFFHSKDEFPVSVAGELHPLKEDLGGIELVVDLEVASVNDLQDTYLWDWVWREFVAVARKLGMKRGASEAFLFFSVTSDLESLEAPGGAGVLVNWILGEACR